MFEPVAFDFADPSTFRKTFAEVATMFLVRPPALARVSDLTPALEAGVAAGLRHVVFLSVQGADKIPVLPHSRIERWLRAAPLETTMLRPSFFDQNLTSVHGTEIRSRSTLSVPAGRGRTAFIDARDVADVASLVLAEPAPHAGRAYTLTGSEALDYDEVCAVLSVACGRTIHYTRPGLLRYLLTARRRSGLSTPLVATTAAVYSTARLGLAGNLRPDAANLLGRTPTTLAEFAARERQSFI